MIFPKKSSLITAVKIWKRNCLWSCLIVYLPSTANGSANDTCTVLLMITFRQSAERQLCCWVAVRHLKLLKHKKPQCCSSEALNLEVISEPQSNAVLGHVSAYYRMSVGLMTLVCMSFQVKMSRWMIRKNSFLPMLPLSQYVSPTPSVVSTTL